MTFYDLNMNSKLITNTQDPTSAQDVATKNYIDSILSGFMKQVKVERFTADGTFVVPVGATYAIAHIKGGGGGAGQSGSGTGGTSSVDFVSGIITATGGLGVDSLSGVTPVTASAKAGTINNGEGGSMTTQFISPGVAVSQIVVYGLNGAIITCGADVAFGQSIAVVVGLGGVAGTLGAAGGSGYVYIEYY